ncbi:MAG: type II toxin-antitoxin system HicB family antitoxin [bacterium]|nr:type II toxin-antitoxin system HicB family antitoxin [bacterium]
MKNIFYYLDLPYTVIMRKNEDGIYESRIAELDGCMSHGKTREESMIMIEDAKRCWIETALEDGDIIPEPEQDYLSEVIHLYGIHLESKISSNRRVAMAV